MRGYVATTGSRRDGDNSHHSALERLPAGRLIVSVRAGCHSVE